MLIVLQEFVPCLGKYSPTRSASVGESHPGGSVSSTSVEVCAFIFAVLSPQANYISLSHTVYCQARLQLVTRWS